MLGVTQFVKKTRSRDGYVAMLLYNLKQMCIMITLQKSVVVYLFSSLTRLIRITTVNENLDSLCEPNYIFIIEINRL